MESATTISGRSDAQRHLMRAPTTARSMDKLPSSSHVGSNTTVSRFFSGGTTPSGKLAFGSPPPMSRSKLSFTSMPKQGTEVADSQRGMSLSFTPLLRSNSSQNDADTTSKQYQHRRNGTAPKVDCWGEKAATVVKQRQHAKPSPSPSPSPTTEPKANSPPGNEHPESCSHVEEVENVVQATANALLLPALQETLLRVQELEEALDEERKRNDQMARELRCMQEQQSSGQLKDALAREFARAEDLQETLLQERKQSHELKNLNVTLLTMRLSEWATGWPAKESSEREYNKEQLHDELLNIGPANRQDAQEHNVRSIERKVKNLVSGNAELSSFVEKVVGKKCLDDFVEQVAVYALSCDPNLSLNEN